MDRDEAKRIIEVLIFASITPLSLSAMKEILKEDVSPQDILALIEELNSEYAASGRSFQIREIAGGFQMLTDSYFAKWISALYDKKPDRLTGPSLETLAIIAYKQPITRSEIEVIRGVNVDGVLRTLEEHGMIRSRGRRDGPGRPILYGTTNFFMQHFGLKSMDDLPRLKEFKESDLDFIKEKVSTKVMDTETGRLEKKDVTGTPDIVNEEKIKDGEPEETA
ncbi:MAG: SMC-Scp complex subunit ScpB [Omnitrophica bacterium RIFCSPLOWO2_01_FULL_45_10]|nr:MAG: SMC-Scp complex subunit ScpB [Omnitrophica bacterium RIFCSPLOWO2_01_FULL_45_10]